MVKTFRHMGMSDHVFKDLAVPDQLGISVIDQHLGGSEASIVLIAHAETVGSRIFHN